MDGNMNHITICKMTEFIGDSSNNLQIGNYRNKSRKNFKYHIIIINSILFSNTTVE